MVAVPQSVGDLTWLRSINLANNQLSELPASICGLANLQRLDAASNVLTAIHEDIGNLRRLERLELSFNRLTMLPESMGELSSLIQLRVWHNLMTELPDAIARLRSLNELDLDNNELFLIPASISDLVRLESLCLSHNHLTEIPHFLQQLRKLKNLELRSNALTSIPEFIGQLTALQRLDVRDNALGALPDSIGSLRNLRDLSVAGNHLTSLPESIGQLTSLAELSASNNRLTALPDSIETCRSLAMVDLAKNNLQSLPRGMRRLALLSLWLHDNPALGLPRSVLGKYGEHDEFERSASRPQAILDAFFAIESRDGQPLNEIKLVLVGRGAAGKTSIARRLAKNTFSRTERETQGVDISRWRLACEAQSVNVNIWDFAGQVVTHSTHQFFLSESSVYVLVLTGREDTQKSDAEYWLRLIRAFASDEQGQVSPVIVTLNKSDTHPFKIDRLGLQEKYPFITAFVETDCKSGRGIDELKSELTRVIAGMDIVKQIFKQSWWNIKKALEKAQRSRNYLPYTTFQQICSKHGETEPARQRFLADVFHALGVALNYGQDARLRDATVLNPRWVTEGIYKLLREGVPDDGSAVLTMERVRAVLGDEPDKMQRYLVELMRRFDLAFPLDEGDDQWLVPQRLPAEQPELGPHWADPLEATRLRYTYAVIPEGLLPRFISRTYPLSENPIEGNESLPRWASGVVLANGDARALVRVDHAERRINVVVTGVRDTRLELLGVIQSDFRTIHSDISGLGEVEELEIEGQPGICVPVKTLRADEANHVQSSATTLGGTISINATAQLNRLSDPPARDTHLWRPRLFISYSSADARQMEHLLVRLKPMKETYGLLDTWVDRCIQPGGEWDREIRRELEHADLVLLLVSATFLASSYIRDVEVARAVERADAGDCIVVPVILEESDWQGSPFARFNAIPRKGKPVRDWTPQRKAWHAVSAELKQLLIDLIDCRPRNAMYGS